MRTLAAILAACALVAAQTAPKDPLLIAVCGKTEAQLRAIVDSAAQRGKPIEVPEDGVSVLHVAPTVLDALGVQVPEEMDLAPLAVR